MEKAQFTYTLEVEDWLAFNQYHAQNFAAIRRNRKILQIVFALIFILLSGLYLLSGSLFMAAFWGVMAVLWLFGLQKFVDWSMKKRLLKALAGGKNSWLGLYEASITPEAFFSKSRTGEGKYYWQAMEQIVSTDDYIFIYVTPLSAVIIPKRTYSGDMPFDKLAAQMQSYFQAAG
jgi:hypothetical protein